MIHALITIALAALAWPFGLHTEMASLTAAFYCGREHSQAEYRAIAMTYYGKRASAPWWCGFVPSAWNAKSMMDWIGPFAISIFYICI